MTPRITIYDGAIPMLDEIARLHHTSALDALDYSGIKLRKSTRDAFHASKSHFWHSRFVNGKRQVYKSSESAVFGKRTKNGGVDNPPSMANLITSFLMPTHLTLVVAGMNPNTRVNTYRDGKITGNVKLDRVWNASYQILKKLNYGGTYDSLDPKYKHLTRRKEAMKNSRFKNMLGARYEGRGFIERGRANVVGEVTDIMTSKLESLIHKQVNRANVRATVRTA